MGNLMRILHIFPFLLLTNADNEYKTVLSGPRFHFSGSFICDPVTLNNNINNFDISSFIPHHALRESEGGKGSYSPRGTNSFTLVDTKVESVCYANQTCTMDEEVDGFIGSKINDNLQSTPKIVDIDPQDPVGVTQIWAMKINIGDILKADADALTMRRMWKREVSQNKNLDSTATATFHGILQNIEFDSDSAGSQFVKQLRNEVKRSKSKQLSIRFCLDMFRYNHTGRIYGTIGCQGHKAPTSNLFSRAMVPLDISSFHKASFMVDEENKVIVFDFGGSFQTNEDGMHLRNLTENYLITYRRLGGYEKLSLKANDSCILNREILGTVPLSYKDWLTRKAGFLTLSIKDDQMNEIKYRPLEIIKIKNEGSMIICKGTVLQERHDGINIFPKTSFAFREESGAALNLEFLASKFGQPHPGVEIRLMQHCKHKVDMYCEPRLPLPLTLKTIENGLAETVIKLPLVKTPRKVMDGQIYNIVFYNKSYNGEDRIKRNFESDHYSSIVVKVFDHIEYPAETTWVDHVYPIFSQYANLFPVMKTPTFDMSNYYSVVRKKNIVIMSLQLPINHSSYMPVTRDLSQRKRRMIIDWLSKDNPKIGKVEKLMNIQHLRSLLQTALEVEHATLPPYFTALWSIRDGYNRHIHQLIKTVARQEMLHMGLVANMINAVGGHPSFTHSTFIPRYPSSLPGGLHPDLVLSLEKLSVDVTKNVFMKIEEPDLNPENQRIRKVIFDHMKLLRFQRKCLIEQDSNDCTNYMEMTSHKAIEKGCPSVVNEYLERLSDQQLDNDASSDVYGSDERRELFNFKDNIASFYTHLLVVLARLTNCGDDESIFTGKQGLQLSTDNFRYGNGKLIEVNDYVSAVSAIKVIIEEGEGTSDCDPKVHYSDAHDDLSHYTIFETITKGHQIRMKKGKGSVRGMNISDIDCEDAYGFSGPAVTFLPEGIWPIIKNAKQSDYKKGTLPSIRSKIFTHIYNRLLGALHKAFNGDKDHFKNALFLMYAVDYYGRELVKLTINDKDVPHLRRNAAPIFKWIANDQLTSKNAKKKIDNLLKLHNIDKNVKKYSSGHKTKTKHLKARSKNRNLNMHNRKSYLINEYRRKSRKKEYLKAIKYQRHHEGGRKRFEDDDGYSYDYGERKKHLNSNKKINDNIMHLWDFYNGEVDEDDIDRTIEELAFRMFAVNGNDDRDDDRNYHRYNSLRD